jgi:hypothetical protein
MLRFTAAGVVAAPRAAQLRVGVELGHGVSAGAPTPSRGMTAEEVHRALQHFTVGQRGPRGTPCETVVLSGVPSEGLGALDAAVRAGRAEGVRHVVVHATVDRDPVRPAWVDEVVRFVRAPDDVGAADTVVVPLDDGQLDVRAEAVRAALGRSPRRVVLTWPFPGGASTGPRAVAAPADAVVAWLDRGLGELLEASGVRWELKGLPACLAGRWRARRARTRNRWYVDADHGPHAAAGALLFFPDVARYAKVDSCRFCALDGVCDGAPSGWLAASEGRPALTPLTALSAAEG